MRQSGGCRLQTRLGSPVLGSLHRSFVWFEGASLAELVLRCLGCLCLVSAPLSSGVHGVSLWG
jgi:hypothetical protein